MAVIDINLKEVKEANQILPSLSCILSGVKRELSLLKWKIPEEEPDIDNESLRERISEIAKKVDHIESKLNEVYILTNSCVSQYMEMEERILSNQDIFK